ncbi:hypothetical protein D3C76_844480 [compost metagenome]
MFGRVIVGDDVVAFPRPRAEPGSAPHFFAHPAIERITLGVMEQAFEVVPVVTLAPRRGRHGDLLFSGQAVEQAFGE